MNTFKSNLTEIEHLKITVEALKRDADIQDERHRIATLVSENFVTFLRRLYGNDF